MGINRSVDTTNLGLEEKINNIAGIGRTTENVKENTDAINEASGDVGDKTTLLTTIKTTIVAAVNEILGLFNAHLADTAKHVPYAVTTGNANAYIAAFTPAITALVDGQPISFKINIDSTGASTVNPDGLGAKGLKKTNGTDVTNLKAGGIYSWRYNATTGNFILQGEGASGNATASDLLSGKTAAVDAGEITGTMVDRGTVSTDITTKAQQVTIAEGHHSGSGIVKISATEQAKIIAGNIKCGITLLGQAGSSNVVDTSAGDAVAGDILSGKKAYVDGALVTGNIASKGVATITPTTTNQTIAAGQYLSGIQTISGDAELVAANIKFGANIFGVTGSSVVVDTSAGDAVAADILASKKSYVDGALVIGTMVDRGTVNITPSTGNQAITAGKHSGSGVVYGDADLIAANILSGKNIFGVSGSAINGASMKRHASGSGTTNASDYATISGLAFIPKVVCVYIPNITTHYVMYRTFSTVYAVPLPIGTIDNTSSMSDNGFSAHTNQTSRVFTWEAYE